jgi:polar amino acid transport system permease protein
VIRDFGWLDMLQLLRALQWTLLLSAIAFIGGAVFGLAIALARTARTHALRAAAAGFVEFFQGTPVLIQLFLAYYGLPILVNYRLSAWPAVTLAFTCYAAAFLGEIWRAAIEAVPRGQWDAASSLGLPRAVILLRVVLPQALRISIPSTVGFLVQLIKSTAIAAIIGFVELTRQGQLIVNGTFQPMTVYPIVATLYFAICFPLSEWSRRLERRLDRGLRSPVAAH